MYTTSILIDGNLIRREFSDLVEACRFVRFSTGYDMCPARAWTEVHNGAELCMHVHGAFVSIARLH